MIWARSRFALPARCAASGRKGLGAAAVFLALAAPAAAQTRDALTIRHSHLRALARRKDIL